MNRIDLTDAEWITSSRSEGNGQCVAVAHLGGDAIALRDTKTRGHGPVMLLTAAQWGSFIGGAINGAFDRS